MKNNLNVRKAGSWQGWVVILINQMPMLAIVALMPVLPTLIEHFKGVPNGDLLVPMILTAPGLCIALIAPFAGHLVDKYGRRKLLVVFLFLYGFGGILPFFIDGFNTVITGRLLLGIGEAFVLVLGNSLLGDYFDQKERTKWITIQGVFGSIAVVGLLALSGHLATIGWNYPFLVYGIAIILALLSWVFIYEPSLKNTVVQESIVEKAMAYPVKTMLTIFLITFTFAVLYFVYTIHFSLALDQMGIKDKIKLGNMSAIASTAVPLGAIIFRYVAKRPFWQQMALIFFFFTIGLTGIGLAKDETTVLIMGWIQQLGCGMTIPVLTSWALTILPPQYRGRGMGIWTSGFFLGQFLNPVFVSLIRNVSGGVLQTFALVGGICFVVMVSLLVYNLLLKNKTGKLAF
ncbi:MFS transporter [Flavobacterium sp. XS2P12]|uniref:MFS transporter n=1 Tax=Flavobacterium melibiosi TaxID=3398734 RepID=UPI003A86B501